nr:aldolase II superfamily protein [Candidatus Pantoea persica]
MLTSGGSIEEAFYNLYYLERACQAQLAAQSGGAALIVLPEAVAEKAAQAFDNSIRNKKYQLHWDAYIRQLSRNVL